MFACFDVGAADDPVEARMKKDLTFLASDDCEGRGIETKGINKAADYIAAEFKKAGLTPGGSNDGWFQPFTMNGMSRMESPNTLVLKGPLGQTIDLELNKNFRPMGMSGAGRVSAPVVFVGYGAQAKKLDYDDYKGMDVEGKVLVMLRNAPRVGAVPDAAFDGQAAAVHAALTTKIPIAELKKAAAILFVNASSMARGADPLAEFREHALGMSQARMPTFHIKRSVADQMLQGSLGTTLKDIEQDIDRDLKPRSAALTGWTATLESSVKKPVLDVKNVIGILEGSGPLAKETVVVGAHYDHLGFGQFGSRDKNPKDKLHHGADDNGSGTTAVLELARRFGAMKNRVGRRLVFITFSGEESGLVGSAYYCRKPAIPLEDTVAMVNLDMVGRLAEDPRTKRELLEVGGIGSSKHFAEMIEALNENYHFQIKKNLSGSGPSDHSSFNDKKIPVFFMFTGLHKQYHTPADTVDLINFSGMRRITALTEDLIKQLTVLPERPTWLATSGGARPIPGGGPTLGIAPGYDEGVDGLLIKSVSEGRPAQKAGLKAGDLIVAIGGKPVKDIEGYMVLMRQYRVGDTIDVTIVRDKKESKIPVKLE